MNCKECTLDSCVLHCRLQMVHFAELGRSRRSTISCSYVYSSDGQCVCLLLAWKWVVRAGTKSF